MRIITTGKKIDHTLNFRTVRFQRQEVGRIPNDIFLPTDQTPPLESLKHVRPVIVDQPEMRDGAPNIREVTQRFQATAPSPVVGGVIGAAVGGVAGAVLGGLASALTGQGAFLLGAGALGVAAGGFLGAQNAATKEVQLVVSERPVRSQEMTGVDTAVTRGSLKGKPGYFHSFSAHLETSYHGNYDVPRVQTVRKTT
jgi:hypothetical protein